MNNIFRLRRNISEKPWILIRDSVLGRYQSIDTAIDVQPGQIVQVKFRNLDSADAVSNYVEISFRGDVHSQSYNETFTKAQLDTMPGVILSYTMEYPQTKMTIYNYKPGGTTTMLRTYIYYRILT